MQFIPQPLKSLPDIRRGICGFGVGIFIALAAVWGAMAQDYMVRVWGVDNGLPESSISDVVQTPDGYIWASTLNNGLSRFDGVRFVNFDLPFAARFTGAGVRRLFPDADGTLWINGFGNGGHWQQAAAHATDKGPPRWRGRLAPICSIRCA